MNVSTGRFIRGQNRLKACEFLDGTRLIHNGVNVFDGGTALMTWDTLPPGSPSHEEIPYGFKVWGLKAALEAGYTTLLWADASVLPIAPLDALWERIEERGYWISANGYTNHEWTCKEAYPLLGVTEEENTQIPHVVATAFGLNLQSDIGAKAFAEYFRFSQNGAFRGPWAGGVGIQHRHDQAALSVVAYRLGITLTNPPEWFAYKGGETSDTVLLAHGIC